MAIQQRATPAQLGQFRLPQVPVTLQDAVTRKYLQDLLRALEQQVAVMVGTQDNGVKQPLRSYIDFIGASVTDDLQHDRIQVTYGGGGGAAPVNATYICVSLNGSLTAERVLTAGDGLTSTDGGANGNFTLDVGAGTGLTVSATDIGISNTGVVATTYGSTNDIPIIAVNAQGQIVAATSTPPGGFLFGTNITSPGAYPYLVTSTDLLVMVDTAGGARTINLPVAVTKFAVYIKDAVGNAFSNNITIVPNGSEKVDTAATLVLANNFDGVLLAATGITGDEWAVI